MYNGMRLDIAKQATWHMGLSGVVAAWKVNMHVQFGVLAGRQILVQHEVLPKAERDLLRLCVQCPKLSMPYLTAQVPVLFY